MSKKSKAERTNEWTISFRQPLAEVTIEESANTPPEEVVSEYVRSICNDCPDIIALLNDFDYIVRNEGSGESWQIRGSVEVKLEVRTWDKKKVESMKA